MMISGGGGGLMWRQGSCGGGEPITGDLSHGASDSAPTVRPTVLIQDLGFNQLIFPS